MNALPTTEWDRHRWEDAIRVLQEENCLLFDQLSAVQQELEQRYHEAPSVPASASTASTTVIQITPVDSRLVEVEAENLHYQALVKAQFDVHDLQARSALSSQLGDILINASSSAAAMLAVPAQLHRAWRRNRAEHPPSSLGGKSFEKVIAAYQQDGEQAVESLLSQAKASTAIQANAWTVLARTMLHIDPVVVAAMAQRAYALDPRPFRLKWLVFRLHEADELLEAEALLALLPADVNFSESEMRQAQRLKSEAYQYRLAQARETLAENERKEELQQQWQSLTQERDALAIQCEQQRVRLSLLQDEAVGLRRELEQHASLQQQLVVERESLQTQLADGALKQQEQTILLGQERAHSQSLEEQLAKLKKSHAEQKVLVEEWFDQCVTLQASIAEIVQMRDYQVKVADQLQAQHESLQAGFANLQQANEQQIAIWLEQCEVLRAGLAELDSRCEDLSELAEQRLRLCDSLREEVGRLTQEYDKQAREALSRLEQCESLRAKLAKVVQERDEQAGQAAERLEMCTALRQELDALVLEHAQLQQMAVQRMAQCESLSAELEVLRQSHDQQVELAAQQLAQQEILQAELRDLARLRDEQAELAAQRQGLLLEQARGQFNQEKDKILLVEARQQELENMLADQVKREQEQMSALNAQVEILVAQQPAVGTALESLFKKHSTELQQTRRHLEGLVKTNSANTTRQVQSYMGMQEFFETGNLPAFNSESHSWPVSSDFALFLVQRLVLEQYDLIVEFGSGMSTVMLAKALAMQAKRTGAPVARMVSFDHLDRYYQQARAYLEQSGVAGFVDLVLAPLRSWKGGQGQIQPYYDCNKTLAKLARTRGTSINRILVVVDGPPASTGVQARYPACPMILKNFPAAHIDFLMDDYIRDDEKEVAQRWMADVEAAGLLAVLTEYKFEKDACLITVHPPPDEKVK